MISIIISVIMIGLMILTLPTSAQTASHEDADAGALGYVNRSLEYRGRFWQELDGRLLHRRVSDEILSLVDLQDEGWSAVLDDKVTRYGDGLTRNDLLPCYEDVSVPG